MSFSPLDLRDFKQPQCKKQTEMESNHPGPVRHPRLTGVDRKSLFLEAAAATQPFEAPACNSCHPEAPLERQIQNRFIGRDQMGEFTPFRSPSCHHTLSVILIRFIFADNNCKYNLTNYFTHNILYMKF
ncbi:uncharacterized protein ACO6RY_03810 [Pungitius sinensis]